MENFLIKKDLKSGESIIQLTDFGLACTYDVNNPPTRKCGTLYMIAPEVLTTKYYDEKVDCWSLGVVLYELITGHNPFDKHI